MQNSPRVLVVIPTYNEKENLLQLIPAINRLNLTNLDLLIVDDNSPDGTAVTVKTLTTTTTNLFLLLRDKKNGLGPAYLAGFNYALENNYQVVIQMDADFSHDPQYLLPLIEQTQKTAFVIGSRYVTGGGVENWPWYRETISRLGSWYARTILHTPIKDFTGGFNAWNAHVLQTINLNEIKSNGYCFQIELKYRASKKGFTYYELPIIFKERRSGQSKISKKIIFEAFFKVLWLKRKIKS